MLEHHLFDLTRTWRRRSRPTVLGVFHIGRRTRHHLCPHSTFVDDNHLTNARLATSPGESHADSPNPACQIWSLGPAMDPMKGLNGAATWIRGLTSSGGASYGSSIQKCLRLRHIESTALNKDAGAPLPVPTGRWVDEPLHAPVRRRCRIFHSANGVNSITQRCCPPNGGRHAAIFMNTLTLSMATRRLATTT